MVAPPPSTASPVADLYTVLLVVAWLALLVGILFLCSK